MSIRIICISKASGDHENPYIAISNLGWINESTGNSGKITRTDLYDWIKERGEAYVKDSKGNIAYLTAELSQRGTKFVKTKPDDTKTDNLLSLPECV
jgi:hypothetical protein